jgi:hypothetical protein
MGLKYVMDGLKQGCCLPSRLFEKYVERDVVERDLKSNQMT